MAASPAARRRPVNGRGRSSTTPQRKGGAPEPTAATEPPLKKRKYVPGGPGGGGRYIEADGRETPILRGGAAVRPASTGPRPARGAAQGGAALNGRPADATPSERPERPRRTLSQREVREVREAPAPRSRYSSAAAVAAAVVQGDGFKPREERSWEEFHPDLEIDANLPAFGSELVDGVAPAAADSTSINGATDTPLTNGAHAGLEGLPNGVDIGRSEGAVAGINGSQESPSAPEAALSPSQTYKRRPGRPPRRADSILRAISTPDQPKQIPVPGHNPRERLTLPKPSFRRSDPFVLFEKTTGSIDYVDRTMAHVGYQESDHFIRPENALIRWAEGGIDEDLDLVPTAVSGATDDEEAAGASAGANAAIGTTGVGRVEYDMDEQDQKWLEAYNIARRAEQVEPIKPAIFEITMTKIEKEWHALEKRIPKPNPKPPQTHRPRSSSAAAVSGEPQNEEQDSKCVICDDGDCENTNAIVFCDGCDLAVHQECYGVPFIPEGQWHCRRCQLVGRGIPTCIFCPNTDGAFKQTNSSKWAHLLCAIWIPEVCLGNNTFMEPVMDVEKVPKSRWKLRCAICNQQMGACIQCGNKNCYRAFHVTCGRRAKWCLQNKSAPGAAKLESSALKAYCDKHVPAEWRQTYDVDAATNEAMAFYKYHMRGKVWTDSRATTASATTAAPALHEAPVPSLEEAALRTPLGAGLNNTAKRKRGGAPGKTVWRLPSGAPVIPQTLYDSLEAALGRFTVRRRKDFAVDVCRYWTLKREARRGAALIKRLQLQMDAFSSMEVTRRNYAGMGALGAPRLRRRVAFAAERLREVERLRELCRLVKEREQMKLQDAELLRDLVNIIYFPVPPLLWPIVEKALALDKEGIFHAGLQRIREALERRAYASVTPFSRDLGGALTAVIGLEASLTDPTQIESRIVADRTTLGKTLTAEDKDNRKLARRIIRAVQAALEAAGRRESELCRLPYEKELLDFDQLLDKAGPPRRLSELSLADETLLAEAPLPQDGPAASDEPAGAEDAMELDEPQLNGVVEHGSVPADGRPITTSAAGEPSAVKPLSPPDQLTPASSAPPAPNGAPAPEADAADAAPAATADGIASPAKPPTPPLSAPDEPRAALAAGGVPWYMEPFDPRGTTVYEERWTGREVARGMSEELSDMDDDELSGLVDDAGAGASGGAGGAGAAHGDGAAADDADAEDAEPARPAVQVKRNGRPKRRWRGFK